MVGERRRPYGGPTVRRYSGRPMSGTLGPIFRWFAPRTTDDAGRAVRLCGAPSLEEFPTTRWWQTSAAIAALGEPWITELRLRRLQVLCDMLIHLLMFGGFLICVELVWPKPHWGHYAVALGILVPVRLIAGLAIENQVRTQSTSEIKRAYLVAGRCPSCRTHLKGAPAAGEVHCECASVWRLTGESELRAPPDPIGLFPNSATAREVRGECRRCGYSRIGVAHDALCPECGAMKNGWILLPEPAPTGWPVCAHCRRDMKGRERGRICPDCGVMNGIDWVEPRNIANRSS